MSEIKDKEINYLNVYKRNKDKPDKAVNQKISDGFFPIGNVNVSLKYTTCGKYHDHFYCQTIMRKSYIDMMNKK